MTDRRALWHALSLLLPVLMMSACSGGTSSQSAAPAVPTTAAETVAELSPVDPSTAGSISGRILYEGAVPERKELPMKGNPECSALHATGTALSEEVLVSEGGLQNVFVYVKSGLEGRKFATPSTPVVIDNKDCLYVPHVAGVMVGQPVELLNSDPTLHNVRLKSQNQKNWNLGLPFQGMKQTKKFEAVEVMATLKCDVHPWMTGYVGILDHPYYAVSAANGSYSIQGLPPGEYEIEAWHETLGTRSARISVAASSAQTVDLQYTAA